MAKLLVPGQEERLLFDLLAAHVPKGYELLLNHRLLPPTADMGSRQMRSFLEGCQAMQLLPFCTDGYKYDSQTGIFLKTLRDNNVPVMPGSASLLYEQMLLQPHYASSVSLRNSGVGEDELRRLRIEFLPTLLYTYRIEKAAVFYACSRGCAGLRLTMQYADNGVSVSSTKDPHQPEMGASLDLLLNNVQKGSVGTPK